MGLVLRLLSNQSPDPSALREVALTPAGVVLGRSREADLLIPSGTVARHHVRIVPTADESAARVICLQSTNGTQVRRRDGGLIAVPSGGELRLEVGEGVVLADEYELELVAR